MTEDVLRLAWELDRFAADYDPYEYRDCVDDPTLNTAYYAELIQKGNTEGITDWLRQIISDPERTIEEIETAEKLLRKTVERRINNESFIGRTIGKTMGG